jgi:hypothetical protein
LSASSADAATRYGAVGRFNRVRIS